MSEVELKPCPFCGGKPEILESEPSTANHNEGAAHFSVSCTGFGCQVMPKGNLWHITPDDAEKAWNTRASGWISVDNPPTEEVEVYVFPRPDFGLIYHTGYISVANGCWVTDVEVDGFGMVESVITVTHWMPLPDDPEV